MDLLLNSPKIYISIGFFDLYLKWLVVLVLIYMFWVDYLMAIWPPQNSFCSSPARVAGRLKISIGPQKKEHFNMKAMELSPVIMYSKCILNSAKISRVRLDSRSTFTSIDLIKLSCITQTSTKCRFDGTCYANVAVVILIYISARKLRKVVGKHPAAGKTHRGSQHGVLLTSIDQAEACVEVEQTWTCKECISRTSRRSMMFHAVWTKTSNVVV